MRVRRHFYQQTSCQLNIKDKRSLSHNQTNLLHLSHVEGRTTCGTLFLYGSPKTNGLSQKYPSFVQMRHLKRINPWENPFVVAIERKNLYLVFCEAFILFGKYKKAKKYENQADGKEILEITCILGMLRLTPSVLPSQEGKTMGLNPQTVPKGYMDSDSGIEKVEEFSTSNYLS